jgi:dipeptidyl aminopeptidase/acylaminoacyl peptidase
MWKLVAVVVVVLVAVLVAPGCRSNDRPAPPPTQTKQRPPAADPWAGGNRPPPIEPEATRASDKDYAVARQSFRTKLVREGESPQPWEPAKVPADAREVAYVSSGLKLRAWVSPESTTKRPAVMFLHGGFAFGVDDWLATKAFRDAGYVVMTPILRGENGSPGSFSLYYNELDDVLAAWKVLERRADVDPKRMFITGHSAGGSVALLAALTSPSIRAAAPLSGIVDASIHTEQPKLVPFDAANVEELRMRSALVFAASFKCPTRIYLGDDEGWAKPAAQEAARRAKAAGRDVEVVIVPGDHFTMIEAAIPAAIKFFDQHR